VELDKNEWDNPWTPDIKKCVYLHSVDRIIMIVNDKVGAWGLVSGLWAQLFTPKKRFWYPYKVRMVELGNIGHFILYSQNTFMVLDSANLDAVHVGNREWDWADWGIFNYVLQMGYGIAKFDVENPYPQTFKEVKDVYRINSWDSDASSPIMMVKDTGELGTYVFNSGTFTSLELDNFFWDACFTISNKKAVAVSWFPNASAGDWHLWSLDWSSGLLVSNSWVWDDGDGGAKAIKFFEQNGNSYLLFATKNTGHIRRYVENS
jgi:hypothetical protein